MSNALAELSTLRSDCDWKCSHPQILPTDSKSPQIMPLAFVAASDEDADVAALWKDVWGEGSSSEAAALRLYVSEILALLLQGTFPWSPHRNSSVLSCSTNLHCLFCQHAGVPAHYVVELKQNACLAASASTVELYSLCLLLSAPVQ